MTAIMGSVFFAHAIYQLRHPDWRRRGWWAKHPLVSYLVGGSQRSAKIGVYLELLGAAVMVAGGIAAMIL
jgi:hypothetical protein